MPEIPEVVLLPLTKSEVMMVLNALSSHHLHLKQQDFLDDQIVNSSMKG